MKKKHLPSTEFAAFIGLDWADTKHDICLQVADSDTAEYFVLEHRPESIDDWARELRQRFGGRPVALALELFKGPIVAALSKYDFFVLFPINPATLAKYRETWTHSGAKDDPTDAQLALELLTKQSRALSSPEPSEPPDARARATQRASPTPGR